MKAVMKLPYADIAEPIETWYDGVNNHQRTEYYNGLDTVIERPDISTSWQINPVINSQMCFATAGTDSLTVMLPDLTGFVAQSTTVYINGHECTDYQLQQQIGDKLNVYDFYVDAQTQVPVQYTMYGYDTLLGSHYDIYILEYLEFEPMNFAANDAHFIEPSMGCGSFPGPGLNPMKSLSYHLPSAHSASTTNELTEEYKNFLNTHAKNYPTALETKEREMYFLHNNKYINHVNHKNKVSGESLRLAMNHLGDLKQEELNIYHGIVPSRPKNLMAPDAESYSMKSQVHEIPTSMDWRLKGNVVGPVKDQGICGSCWSFGSTGVIEGQYSLATGSFKSFSEQQLVDCDWTEGSNGCDGGEDFRAYRFIMSNGGLATTADYGNYLMVDGWCRTNVTTTVTIKSFVNVTSGDENALMDAITNVGPISVAIDAGHKSLSFYASGVYKEPECKNGLNDLDHAVLAVGFGTSESGENYWIIKNSWSTHWGDEGYVKMSRDNNMCGVATFPTYPNVVPLQ